MLSVMHVMTAFLKSLHKPVKFWNFTGPRNEMSRIENLEDGQYEVVYMHPNIIEECNPITKDLLIQALSDLGFIDEDGDGQVIVYRTDDLKEAESVKMKAKKVILSNIIHTS